MHTQESVRALINTSGEHHLWTGYVEKAKGKDTGYGRIYFQGTRRYVHVLVYEWEHGPLQPGWTVDHLCGITECQRLAHLEAVPPGENRRRERDRATGCRNGHPLSERRWVSTTGDAYCRQCSRERNWERARRLGQPERGKRVDY